MKPYFEFLAEAVRVICPKYITMEYNKRNPSDALKLSKIKHQLFTEKKTTMEVFQYLKEHDIIGGVINHKETFKTSGIDTHITYKNNYSIDLYEFCSWRDFHLCVAECCRGSSCGYRIPYNRKWSNTFGYH